MKKIFKKIISFFTLKRTLKIFICLIACLFIFLAAFHYALTYILQSNQVKDKISSFANEKMNLELDFDKISANLFYFSLNNVNVKIKGDSKTFFSVKEVSFYFAPIRLIFGKLHVFRIGIIDPAINLSKNSEGKFNFEKILEAPLFKQPDNQTEQTKQEQSDDDNFDLTCKHIQIRDAKFEYIDSQNNMDIKVLNFTLNISDLSFIKPFKIQSNIKISADINETIQIPDISITLDSVCNLQNLQLEQASLYIKKFFIKTDEATITISGQINNFKNPNVSLNTKIKDLSSDTVKYIMKDKNFSTTDFYISLIDLNSDVETNLEKETVTVKKLSADILSSVISANGYLNYSKMIYDFNLSTDFVLDKTTEISNMVNQYQPKGNIKTNLHLTNDNIEGIIDLIKIGAFVEQAGTLSDINSTINIKNLSDISAKQITGKLNDNPFSASAAYILKDKIMNITANFKADKINIKSSSKKEEKQPEPAKEEDKTKTEEGSKSFPEWLKAINITANSDIKQLNSYLFSGSDISLKINLSDITPKLDKTNGTIALFTKNGTIKNLYELSDSNALMKVMFTSLVVVSKVINTLNVLDVLKSIGNVMTKDNDNADSESEQNEEHEQINGKLDYEKFETVINFVKGVANFQNCSFLSNVFSFKVGGNINFINENLKMKVNAAPGKQYSDDGVMPLTIKISGTISEPNGSLSLLGSISSLLTQSLFNNLASNFLKKSISGLMNLGSQDGVATVDDNPQGQDNTKDKTVFIE